MKNKHMITAEEAWEKILVKYNIVEEIEAKGVFFIKASQIKEFKEPRLMSKWDSSMQLPNALKRNKINILPNSRSSYVLSDFLLYENLPELSNHITQMISINFTEFESININDIRSEASAINAMVISNILSDFLEIEKNVSTFNGRMGTGVFEFDIDTCRGIKQHIIVNNSQCEIDGGFENEESVVIMEAKNVLHPDFNIRQLYYPYRLWKKKVSKPIRLIFSIYSNKIFRLFEYTFTSINDYSSIKLIRNKNYSLQDTKIELDELVKIREKTTVKCDDNQANLTLPPFIQADSFERVISLLENMYDNPMDDEKIASLMHFGSNISNGRAYYRQSQYYSNAGCYLGIFQKRKGESNTSVTFLTCLGKEVYQMQYKSRQLKLVELMLEHEIFSKCFDEMIQNGGELLDRKYIESLMRNLNVCNESQISRRSNSVRGWLKWIFSLLKFT